MAGPQVVSGDRERQLDLTGCSCSALYRLRTLPRSFTANACTEKDNIKMETTNHDTQFNYQLLGRLQQDCDYYLGHGNRAKKHLWAGDEAAQIAKMKEIYEGLSEKPEWLTLEQIAQYEAAMVVTK